MTKQHSASNNKTSTKYHSNEEFEYKKSSKKRNPKRKINKDDNDIKFSKWR